MVFHLVTRNPHQPCLKWAGATVLLQIFPRGKEHLLHKVIYQITSRKQARMHVCVDSIGEAAHELRSCLAVLAPDSRSQVGITLVCRVRCLLDIRPLAPRYAQNLAPQHNSRASASSPPHGIWSIWEYEGSTLEVIATNPA